MSQISRIPRGRPMSKFAKMEANLGKDHQQSCLKSSENIRAHNQMVPTLVPHKLKFSEKSSFPAASTKRSKAHVDQKQQCSDRRGISQIKRSEKALIEKVQHLEKKLCSAESELTASREHLQQQEKDLSILHQKVEESTEESNSIRLRNTKLCEILEKRNIDPVTFKELDTGADVQESGMRGDLQAQDVLSSITHMDELCHQVDNRLKTMVFDTEAAFA